MPSDVPDHRAAAPEELQVLADRVRVLTGGELTQGRYEVFEVNGSAGSGAPLHQHPWDEELHVLEGEIVIGVADRWDRYTAGQSLRVPAGVLHGFRVVSESARFLALTSPAGAGELFRALHYAAAQAPLTEELIVRISAQHRVSGPGRPRAPQAPRRKPARAG
jgi:quercetin dioxygenase-like cupin family protein